MVPKNLRRWRFIIILPKKQNFYRIYIKKHTTKVTKKFEFLCFNWSYAQKHTTMADKFLRKA